MIVGIGTDLCSISRMKEATKNDHFVGRIFAREEIDYALSKGDPAKHFASAYAAKEALAKASGLGMFEMGLNSSWVRRENDGPVLMCDNSLRERLGKRRVQKTWLSLTHEGDFALAFVVLES